MEPHASGLVTAGIAGIALAVMATVVAGVYRAYRGAPGRTRVTAIVAAAIVAWAALTWILAAGGVLLHVEKRPPPFAFIVVGLVGLALGLGLSRVGLRLATLPLAWLVGFHGFRFVLELVMHRAATEGVMPPQMTWTGRNVDIATGILAIAVAALAARGHAPRGLVWAWNVLGCVLLALVVAVAISSTPPFHAFGTDPRHLNTWVLYPPFVWLPAILVAAALAGHVVVTRRLLAIRGAG